LATNHFEVGRSPSRPRAGVGGQRLHAAPHLVDMLPLPVLQRVALGAQHRTRDRGRNLWMFSLSGLGSKPVLWRQKGVSIAPPPGERARPACRPVDAPCAGRQLASEREFGAHHLSMMTHADANESKTET